MLETTRLGHRGEEPEDARRVDVEPARLRRAARARARRRRPVPARRGAAAAAAGERSRAATQPRPRPSRRNAVQRRRRRRGRRRPPIGRGGLRAGVGGERRQRRDDRGARRRTRRASGSRRATSRASTGTPSRAGRSAERATPSRVVKLAVVVQRYGADINGGAELHARYIAERLARHAEVEVVTTCARDYVTWRNELPAGVEQVNGVPVRRFPVAHERRPARVRPAVAPRVRRTRTRSPTSSRWLESEGPASPALVDYIERAAAGLDFVLLFSYRYYHAWHGARRRRAQRRSSCRRPSAIPAIGLSIFGPIFRGVRALMYNSPEERAMIQAAAGNQRRARRRRRRRLGGAGAHRSRRGSGRKFDMRRPFAIYVGRIDENKGCGELFDSLPALRARRSRAAWTSCSSAAPIMPVPAASADPSSRLPRRPGQVRRAGRGRPADHAVVLREPVDGRARGVGARPAGARQRPLRRAEGPVHPQQRRAYYESYEEFAEALYALESNGPLHARLGRNGRDVLRAALRLAGDRAQVPRHVRPARRREPPRRAADRAAARLVRATPARPCPPPRRSSPASRPAPSIARRRRRRTTAVRHERTTSRRAARPPGPRHARLRRRDRPRGARHPARAARAPATTPRSSSRPPIRGSSRSRLDYRDLVGAHRARRTS